MKPLEKLPINCLWVVEMSVFTICLKFIWTFCRCYLCRKSNGNNLRVQRQKVLFQISDTTRRNTSLPPSLRTTFNNFVRNRHIKSPLWMAWLLNCTFIFLHSKKCPLKKSKFQIQFEMLRASCENANKLSILAIEARV